MSVSMASVNMGGRSAKITATTQNRRRPTWVLFFGGSILLILVVLLLADNLYHPEKFKIEEIEVMGEFQHVSAEEVTKVVRNFMAGNYFSVSLHQLEHHIENLPWVLSASLRTKWPSTIQVSVVEIEPVAKWGDTQWLNFDGALVDRQPGEFSDHLPALQGPVLEKDLIWKNFSRWSALFAQSGLTLEQLELDQRDLWYLDLRLSPLAAEQSEVRNEVLHVVGMTIDNHRADYKIARFINAFNQQLVPKFKLMESIDLRYPNGFAVDWKEEGSAGEMSRVSENG